MKSRSSFAAKILIPLLLAFCLASVSVARGQQSRAAEAQAQARAAQAEAQAVAALAARVRDVARASGEDPHAGKSLEHALAETVASAMGRRVEAAVVLESLAVAGAGGGARVTAVAELARPVAFSAGQLRAVSLRIKGAYAHLDGLREYIEGFRVLPVAVTAFSAAERGFEFTLTVFGS